MLTSCRRSTGSRRRAFTLVELLVVVAIMTMLIAMLLPALTAARGAAQRGVCVSNIHQQLLAMDSYASDSMRKFPGHRDYAPYAISNYQNSSTIDPVTGINRNSWHFALFSYIPDSRIMLCPLLNNFGEYCADTCWWVNSDVTYGGWNSNLNPHNTSKKYAVWIATPYCWYANFTDYWNQRPTFTPDTTPWPYTGYASPTAPLVGHSVIVNLTGIADRSHGGANYQTGGTLKDVTSTDVPIGCVDNSVSLHHRGEWRLRATWHQNQMTTYY